MQQRQVAEHRPSPTRRRLLGRLTPTLALVAALTTSVLTATGASAAAPAAKVLIVVEENHSLAQMQAGMPYTFSLAQTYGYATGHRAIGHPSLPNYLAIVGGSTFGVVDDQAPAAHPINAPTVFGQALARGLTAKTYAESAPTACAMTGTGAYAVRHNPWTYFTPAAERTHCASSDVPFSSFSGDVSAGRLPNVGLVVPNLCNDAHDCPLSTADAWFRQQMQAVFTGPDWKAGRLVVILTADEPDTGSAPVLTVVIHPSQSHKVVSTPLTHYSLTRLCDDIAHAPYLRNAASAPSLSAAFGLPIA
jgi:acid phosphatase